MKLFNLFGRKPDEPPHGAEKKLDEEQITKNIFTAQRQNRKRS